MLNNLERLGIQISIDDFGTGYFSLSYPKRFLVDMLKIDQSFVRDIPADPDDDVIAQAIIAMAHSLGIQVIAEGVETAKQLSFMRAHQCDGMQGYYFSKPVTAEAMTKLLLNDRHLTVCKSSKTDKRAGAKPTNE